MKVFRVILCILLLTAMTFAPPYLARQSRRDFFAELSAREKPEFTGTVVLYHIVSKRTCTGRKCQVFKGQEQEVLR